MSSCEWFLVYKYANKELSGRGDILKKSQSGKCDAFCRFAI